MKYLLVLGAFLIYSFATGQNAAESKEYLGILTLTEKYTDEKNWTQKDQEVIGEHFQRLVKMKNEGIVIIAGRTQLETNDPNMMGLVIFNAKDEKAALQFMNEDPAVKNNIMKAKVVPYSIALSKCQ